MTLLAPYVKTKFLGSGGSMVARLKLKGIDGRAPPGVNCSSASGFEKNLLVEWETTLQHLQIARTPC
jgi:hypothetical protein